MRRENSDISVEYLSNAGTSLYNNDYYGSAELPGFACYIVADGITDDKVKTLSAQVAIEAVIDAFTERPGISKAALRRYMKVAHNALINNSYDHREKASIAIFVTNYQSARVAHVGNARCTIYRKSRVFWESSDDSLSWEMMEQGEIQKDKIAKHEERGNLSKYLGQYGNFWPNISRKIKLQEGDAFALASKGIWENITPFDLITAFAENEADLEKTLITLDRFITDLEAPRTLTPVGNGSRTKGKKKPLPQDREISNYTLALGFVGKIYQDPNKAKRRKMILRIVIPIVIIILILAIILFFVARNRRHKREDMETLYISAMEYISTDNYVKAGEDLNSAMDIAKSLRDKGYQLEFDSHIKLVEAINSADDLLDSGKFDEAQQGFLAARNYSRHTDYVGQSYIERKLDIAADYSEVHDLLILGDQLLDQGNFELAEKKFTEARSLAAGIYYLDGKKEAISSLERVYQAIAEEEALEAERLTTENEEALDRVQDELAAAELVSEGDKAFAEGDLIAARLYYEMAREKYTDLENETILGNIDTRLTLIDEKESANKDRSALAERYIEQGDTYLEKKLYTSAKRQYILARDVYSDLGDESNLKNVESKIDTVDTHIAQETIEASKSSVGNR